jgi:hypothetical protein
MKTETINLASPSPGTQRTLTLYRFGNADARPKVYIQAGLHADEWPGLLVIQHLIPLLRDRQAHGRITGEIIVVPYANPVGMGQNVFGYTAGRFDLAGTGNFNRNFGDLYPPVKEAVANKLGHDEGENQRLVRDALKEAVSRLPAESEASQLKKALLSLSIDADYIFDLHCDDHSSAHIYAVEQQTAKAKDLCQSLGFDYLFTEGLDGIVAFDGTHLQPWYRLAQEFPDLPVPMPALAVTVEYRGQYDINDELAEADALNLFNYLAEQKVLFSATPESETVKTRYKLPLVSPLGAVDTVLAQSTGLLIYKHGLNTMIQEGETFAEIILLDQPPPSNRQPVIARTQGVLMAMTHRKLVKPGDLIAKIAGQSPLEHRQAGNLLQL